MIVVMAQIGSFVPADSCSLSPFDSIHTRMGASDNIMAGQSTFFLELQQTSQMLKNATNKSLVILDEVRSVSQSLYLFSVPPLLLEQPCSLMSLGLFTTYISFRFLLFS